MPKKVPPSSEFGERLMRLRLARGLTQTQLAEAIGSLTTGDLPLRDDCRFPPTHVVVELARALDVSTDELLGLKPAKKAAIDGRRKTRKPSRLWKKFQQVQKLPEKDQRAVIRLLNSLVSARE